ncbi:MAG TPA: penicillin-insensitive murein endopeptidase, partial [Polyangiaceae bacterium]|nr:penicillin-insensitive murein endopeptidase [Polyangiaceae bacterium]
GEDLPAMSAAVPEAAEAEHVDSEDSSDEAEEPDDGSEEADSEAVTGVARPHPLDGLSDQEIASAVATHIATLGPMSVGTPSAGMLVNGRNAQKNELYVPVAPGTAWGTDETLGYLDAALTKVHATIPGTPPLPLGDISAERGGPISPHVSHQAGRDLDIGYFYRGEQRWYRRGNAQNLDLPRNWAFVRALVTETDVDLIFIDHSIQALLKDYALESGEDRTWVEGLFGGSGQRAIIRHARGHATHIHVRFFNPIAQETARRSYSALVARGIVPPVQSYLSHRVRKNETLGKIAKKYGVSVESIKRANRLKKSLIREGHAYLIPVAHPRPAPPAQRLAFPARRLPPDAPRRASAESATSKR